MYRKGRGVARNYEKAVEWYLKAAEQGHATAQFNLGIMYRKGRGVAQNDEIAVEWFLKAAEQGYATAQNNLGLMYAYGRGVAQNYKKAVKFYSQAAKQGHAMAQSNLGWMYLEGQGVAQNDEKAVKLYSKAAEQGYAGAQNTLGWMYQEGRGVAQNYEKAVELYSQAAKQGHATAQFNLGWMYSEGLGISKDNEQAQLWWEKYINNIGLTLVQDEDIKIITDFFNGRLLNTSPFTKPFMDCSLRAKRLKLKINNKTAQHAITIYQLLQNLDYAGLKESFQDIDESTKDKFTPENYINELILLCSKSTRERMVSFFWVTTISKSDRRYQIVKKMLLHMQTKLGKIKPTGSNRLNIDGIEPTQLVLMFNNILTYIAEDENYHNKKELLTKMITAANTEKSYLSRPPHEIIERISNYVIENSIPSETRKDLVSVSLTRLQC